MNGKKVGFKRFGAMLAVSVASVASIGVASAQDLATDIAAAETEVLANISTVQGMMIAVVILIMSVGIVLGLMKRKGG